MSNGDRGPGPSGGRGSSKRGGRQAKSRGRGQAKSRGGGRQKDSRPAKGAKSSEDFTSGDSARKDSLPLSAISIKLKENVNIAQDEFCPLREPGIYFPEMDIRICPVTV